MKSLVVGIGLMLAVMCFASRADAGLITYQLSGTASGKIGNTLFTDKQVLYTGIGDTNNVQTFINAGNTFYANPFTTLTVNISGVGTATFTEATEIFGIPQAIVRIIERDPQFERSEVRSPEAFDHVQAFAGAVSLAALEAQGA